MTPSKILFYLSISFVVGIFIESSFGVAQDKATKIPQGVTFQVLWAFLLSAVLIICLSFTALRGPSSKNRGRASILLLGFCVLFLTLGILRTQISEFNITSDKLSKLNNKGKVSLIGIISSEPDVRDTYQKIKVDSGGSTVLVTTNKYPEYEYLDKIKITGKLEAPGQEGDFSYKKYLMKDGIYSVMNFPEVELVEAGRDRVSFFRDPFSFVYCGILWFKQKLRESIRKNYSPPQSLILEGTLLGDNGVMSQDLKNKLNITGLRHIIAVSGTHVVILGAILMSFLLALGLWRGQAFYISIVFIWLYIILTGLPASGIRAGIMGSLFLLAQKLGRQSSGSRIIIMAGAVMLAQNPLLLFYDVGFQLSFLASMGIIYLEPFLKNLLSDFCKIITTKRSLQKIHDREFFATMGKNSENLLGMLSVTFAAQIFTLPIMVYNFGNMSLISPLTNILVLPIVSWLMIFGFLSSILGIASQFLGWIISIPCWFLLTYFIKVVDIFSQPWAVKTVENVHWIWLVVSYLVLAIVVSWLQKNQKLKILEY